LIADGWQDDEFRIERHIVAARGNGMCHAKTPAPQQRGQNGEMPLMNTLIFGGSGFVGLNLAEHLLSKGHAVSLFDRRLPFDAALAALRALPGKLTVITGDVRDATAVKEAVVRGTEIVVLGAAITAGPERDATDPTGILSVNLMAQIPMLEAARDAGVRRVINLSSAAAYGAAGERTAFLEETTPVDPVGLYPITKWASERIGARLGNLWGLDVVSARLSGVFGPWEHETGVRDTPSPQFQVLRALERGEPALLPRPGCRDWTYAVDVAEALAAVAVAPKLTHPVLNISTQTPWSVLDWGQLMLRQFAGGICRLVEPGEPATINFYGPTDRAPMSTATIAAETGWRARFDMAASASHLSQWRKGVDGAPA
jgi:UDP-glucose 4-epimerase